MRSCVYLLLLAAVLVGSAEVQADNNRGTVVEGVRWHGHEHLSRSNRVLHDAFGSRVIWGVHYRHLNTYDANRNSLTSRGYDDVLVTYRVRGERRRQDDRRRRDDRGRRGNIAIGIAQSFSQYRPQEIVIEHFDRTRSVVIDVDDIRGVFLPHANGYGDVTFDERVLDHLSAEWRRRFPSDGARYRFYGRVAAIFSDGNHLVEVHSVRRGNRRDDSVRLNDRPVVLIEGDYLQRQRRDRDRRDRDRRDRDRRDRDRRDRNADDSTNWLN